MTVPRVDTIVRGPRQLSAFAAVVGAVAGPGLFLSYYLLSIHFGLPTGWRAAVVVLAVHVVVWSLVVYRVRPRSAPSWLLALLAVAVPYAVLAWMTFDVLAHADPIGVWASLAPTSVVFAGLLVLASTAPDSSTSDRPDPAPPAGAPREWAGPGAPEALDVPAAPDLPAPPARRGDPLAVGVDAAFWQGMTSLLGAEHHDGREQGGVALTTVVDGVQVVVGAVLPEQVSASSVRCEFSVLDVERVRDVLDGLAIQETIGITWIHTHPGLGVFLSGTDVATSARWRTLDPGFRPVVVDITRSTLDTQIGVFDADDRRLAPIGLVDGAVDPTTAHQIACAVLDHYAGSGLSRPLVLVGPAYPAPRPADHDRIHG